VKQINILKVLFERKLFRFNLFDIVMILGLNVLAQLFTPFLLLLLVLAIPVTIWGKRQMEKKDVD
jgi:hypothetical protein